MAARTTRRTPAKRAPKRKAPAKKTETPEQRVDRRMDDHLKSEAFASTVQKVFEDRLRSEVDQKMVSQAARVQATGFSSLFLTCAHCNHHSIVLVPNRELVAMGGRPLACPICGR